MPVALVNLLWQIGLIVGMIWLIVYCSNQAQMRKRRREIERIESTAFEFLSPEDKIVRRQLEAERRRICDKVRLVLGSSAYRRRMEVYGAKYRCSNHCVDVKIPGGVRVSSIMLAIYYKDQLVFEYGRHSTMHLSEKQQVLAYAPDSDWLDIFENYVALVEKEAQEHYREQKRLDDERHQVEQQRAAEDRNKRWKM